MRENIERDKQIYKLWKVGHTIDQISFSTQIPRSTVGYYVKKFKKQGRSKLDFIKIEKGEKIGGTSEENLLMAFLKQMFSRKISDIMKMNSYEEKYYALATFKLLMELSKYCTLTAEELRALFEALMPKNDSVKSEIGIFESIEKDRHDLEKIFRKATKEPETQKNES